MQHAQACFIIHQWRRVWNSIWQVAVTTGFTLSTVHICTCEMYMLSLISLVKSMLKVVASNPSEAAIFLKKYMYLPWEMICVVLLVFLRCLSIYNVHAHVYLANFSRCVKCHYCGLHVLSSSPPPLHVSQASVHARRTRQLRTCTCIHYELLIGTPHSSI